MSELIVHLWLWRKSHFHHFNTKNLFFFHFYSSLKIKLFFLSRHFFNVGKIIFLSILITTTVLHFYSRQKEGNCLSCGLLAFSTTEQFTFWYFCLQNESRGSRGPEGTLRADPIQDPVSARRDEGHRRHSHSRSVGTRKRAQQGLQVNFRRLHKSFFSGSKWFL